jgi:chorismate mutase
MMLSVLRDQIDQINQELVRLLSQRLQIARGIARLKKEQGLPILDAERESILLEQVRQFAKEQQLSPNIIEEIFHLVLDYTRLEMEVSE